MLPLPVSVAIPTYGRDHVLVDTIRALLIQQPSAEEILVVDQTSRHEPETADRLYERDVSGAIRWLRLSQPSVPGAMNHALAEARRPIVLFLDDDIVPAPGLIDVHARSYADDSVWAVSGQVLQPGEVQADIEFPRRSAGINQDLAFPFCSMSTREVHNCMAGNLSVRRQHALEVGGFDENFIRVAYRFETEFCRRLWAYGGKVHFEPRASIQHLQAERGGVRSYGHHLTTLRPYHAVGDYYFAWKHGLTLEAIRYVGSRLRKSVLNRHHLRRPWWIPVSLFVECTAMLWAATLRLRGPRYIGDAKTIGVAKPVPICEPQLSGAGEPHA